MTALVVVVLGVALLLLPRLIARTRGNVEIARSLRAERRARHTDMPLISTAHRRLVDAEEGESLDERTWADLDLDDVFHAVDYTASEPGRQLLYHQLRTPQFDSAALDRLDSAVNRFTSDETLADLVRSTLSQLGDPRAAHLDDLLFGELPSRPALWWTFPLLTASAVSCLALISIWPRAAVVWLAICVVNVGVQIFYKPRVQRFVPALHELPALLRVARILGAVQADEVQSEAHALRNASAELGALRIATRWLMYEPSQASDIQATIYEYVNLLFLLDVNAFVFATNSLRESRTVAQEALHALAFMDVAQSIASWRKTLNYWATPTFLPAQKSLAVDGLYHPLLGAPVANDLVVDGHSVLITGSNMSGKTTFVRTLGVNAVLAQTLHTVCARKWRAPMLLVRTSIGREDSLQDGKSYYLAEVETVLELVRASESGRQHLFLLDELFRGTNTVERVAGAYAVLSYLNRGADLVVAATHDVELLDMLRGGYEMHHFREEVVDEGLTFDYRMRPGPSSTRNAIALLRVLKYPASLVDSALAVVEQGGRTRAVLIEDRLGEIS
jgi:DNA mismatch repair ATPase MutS